MQKSIGQTESLAIFARPKNGKWNIQQILKSMVRQRPQTDELQYNALLKENKKM